MSLTGALHIGRTGIQVHQAAIEVTGNNLANSSTPGYNRQRVVISSYADVDIGNGVYLGQGVQIENVVREVDEALVGRIRDSISNLQGSMTEHELLSQIESIQNELSDSGLNSRLNDFFNALSELGNSPADNGLRTLAIEQGTRLSQHMNGLNEELQSLLRQVDSGIKDNIENVNEILDQIEILNEKISVAESGKGQAHGLRDERDRMLEELATYFEFSTNELNTGEIDVYVSSTPIILGGNSRGVQAEFLSNGISIDVELQVAKDTTPLDPGAGKLGQLFQSRERDVVSAIDTLNTFTQNFIFEFNKVHSQGQGQLNFSQVTGTYRNADPTAALNDLVATNLPYAAETGTFTLNVTQKSTGTRTPTQIAIDLDGLGADTTLNDLVAAINAVSNVNASLTADGKLALGSTSNDFEISFGEDSSGVLAAVGINTFFDGKNAQDIRINSRLSSSPQLLAAGLNYENGFNTESGDNRNALALVEMQNQGISSLNGLSLREYWSRHIEDYAIRTSSASRDVESSSIVTESLEAQRQGVSGVNVDEEAINLLGYQRAFQGSARFISVVDELMETLLSLIR